MIPDASKTILDREFKIELEINTQESKQTEKKTIIMRKRSMRGKAIYNLLSDSIKTGFHVVRSDTTEY